MMLKNYISSLCEVCKTKLYIRENNSKNYKYVAIKKKPYYICSKCTVKDLKNKIKND